jgi:hypothetical protein
MTLLERLSAETPNFFKKVINISLTISAAGAAVLGANSTVPDLNLPPNIVTYAKYAVLAGIVAAAVSKTTVKQ